MLKRQEEKDAANQDIEIVALINKEPADYSNIKEEGSNKLKTEYDKVLHKTRIITYFIAALAISEPLLNGLRYSFLVLYIQSFASNITTQTISTLAFFGMAYTAITSLIIVSMGDKYGHDNTYIISFIVLSAGLLIESIAQSFHIFVIGYFLTKSVASWQIAFAFIPAILPHKYAVTNLATITTAVSILFAMGPICGAAVAKYLSYRAIWIIMTLIHFILLVISILSLKGSMNKLKQMQIPVGIIDTLSEDEQFPVCVTLNKVQNQNEDNTENDINKARDKLMDSVRNYLHFWSKMPSYELWMLLISICMENLAWCMEAIITFYYILWMKNRFGADLVYGTLMMLYLVVIFAVVNVVIPIVISRIIPKYIWVICIACILQICVCVAAAMEFNEKIYYWIYNGIIGILFAIILRASTMCVLELQPKEHTGKVTGLNVFIAFIFRGATIALVGVFWMGPYYSSIWYGIATLSCIILVLSVIMIVMNKTSRSHEGEDVTDAK